MLIENMKRRLLKRAWRWERGSERDGNTLCDILESIKHFRERKKSENEREIRRERHR